MSRSISLLKISRSAIKRWPLFTSSSANLILRDEPKWYKLFSTSSSIDKDVESLIGNIISAPVSRRVETDAQKLCDSYRGFSKDSKSDFIRHLVNKYSLNWTQTESAVRTFLSKSDRFESSNLMATERLRQCLTPPFVSLFNKIGRLPDGVKFLVDFRADIMTLISEVQKLTDQSLAEDSTLPKLRHLSEHLKSVLTLWFSVGFLNLERITWDSSCDIMQKISEYEAVHPVRSWTDMKQRVGPFRRCFVFQHHCLPKEPLVILHVALTPSISDKITDIVRSGPYFGDSTESVGPSSSVSTQAEDLNNIKAAIFYSISSVQKGLLGIDLGNQMIRRVGQQIKSEFSHINQFSSLSPIPEFRKYFLTELKRLIKDDKPSSNDEVSHFIKEEEIKELKGHLKIEEQEPLSLLWSELYQLLRTPLWANDTLLVELLRLPLMRKCAHYLCNEKRRGYALNGVTHFHLRNGAVIWRLNWKGDPSPRGLDNSFGIMVNYRYYIEKLDSNSEKYMEHQSVEIDDNLKPFLSSTPT